MSVQREDLVYRYVLDLADHATAPYLRATRQREQAMNRERRELAAQGRAARTAGGAQAAAARRSAEASMASASSQRRAGAAATTSSTAARRSARAWEAAGAGARVAAQGADSTARAYERSARASEHAIVASRRVQSSYAAEGRAAQNSSRAQARASAARRRETEKARAAAGGVLASGRSAVGFAGVLGIAGIGRDSIEFDKSMRNVNSIAQLSERQLQRLGDRVRALGGATAQQPKTLAEGLYDLVSSGFNADQSMRILASSSKAATAGLTTTEVSTKAVAAVLNAYHRPAGDAKQISDELFRTVDRGVISFESLAENVGDVLPFAASLNVPMKDVGASIATMTKAGISAPETMTRIKAVMTAMLKPSEALGDTLKKQGYESGEALIKAKGFQGALDLLQKTTGGSKEELAKLFPNVRALGGALALTGKNSKTAKSDLDGMNKAAGATNRALAQQSKSTSYQWEKLKANASSLAIAIGSKALPEINKAVAGLLSFGKAHPGIAKVAGAIVAVGIALKALKFTKALLGFDDMIRAARVLKGSRFGTAIASQLGTVVGGFGGRAAKTGGAHIDPVRGPQSPIIAPTAAPKGGRLAGAAGKAGIVGAVIGAGLMIGSDVREGARQKGTLGGVQRLPIIGTAITGARALGRGDLGGAAKAAVSGASPITMAAGTVDRQAFGGAGKRALGGVGKALAPAASQVSKWAGGAAKWFSPIPRAAGTAISQSGRFFSRLPGVASRAVASIPRLIGRGLSSLGRLAGTAASAAGRALLRLPSVAARAIPLMARWAGRVVGFVVTLPIRIGIAMVSLGTTIGRGAVRAGRALATRLPQAASALWGWAKRLPGRVAGFVADMATAVARRARSAGRSLVNGFSSAARGVFGFAKSLPGRVGGFLSALPSTSLNLARRSGSALLTGMKAGAEGLWGFVKGIPGKIISLIGDLAGKLKSVAVNAMKGFAEGFVSAAPKPIRGTLKDALGVVGLDSKRRGGRVRRALATGASALSFAAGGMVPVAVSPGELAVFRDGRAWTVPGASVAADSVHTALPAGTRVYTSHGQSLLNQGYSLDDALTHQMPHFRKGGQVATGKYNSTSYGPPWGGIQGGGTTRTGVNLRSNPHLYGIAVDPSLIPLGSKVHISPNPFSTSSLFTAFDTGGAIKGRRIDFYDWRGRKRQNAWGHRSVEVGVGHGKGGSDSATARLPDRLTFAGGLPSKTGAFAAGYQAEPGSLASAIGDIVTGATAQFEKRTVEVGGASEKGAAGGGQAVRRALIAASTINKAHLPYSSPGDRSLKLVAGAMDCSGSVSKVLNFAGFNTNGVKASPYYKTWGVAGRGKHITTFSKGGMGASGHVWMMINGQAFGTSGQNPGGGAGWFKPASNYPGQFIARHPKGYRGGGIVGADRARKVMARLPKRLQGPAVLAEIQQGGVLPGLRKGGKVDQARKADPYGTRAQVKLWMLDRWREEAPLLGQAAGRGLPFRGGVNFSPKAEFVGYGYDPKHANEGNLFWPTWINHNTGKGRAKQKRLDVGALTQLFFHEVAHRFQSDETRNLPDLLGGKRGPNYMEGGAEAFARDAMRKTGRPVSGTGGLYAGFVRATVRDKGWDWIRHGQFQRQRMRPGGTVGQRNKRAARNAASLARRSKTARSMPAVVSLPTGARGTRIGAALREYAQLIEQVDADTATILRQRLRDIRTERDRIRRGGVRRSERGAYRALAQEASTVARRLGNVRRPVSYRRLEQIDRRLDGQITQARRRPGNAGRVAVRRLTAVQRVVELEMGRRTKMLVESVTKQGETLERGRDKISRSLRMRGLDEASTAGIAALRGYTRASMTSMRSMERKLKQALKRAARGGDTSAVNEIKGQLTELHDQMAETATTWVEQMRAGAIAAAQQQMDALDRRSTDVDRGLRMAGVDSASSAGQGVLAANSRAQMTGLQAIAARLSMVAGSNDPSTDVGQKLLEVRDQIAEATTNWIEQTRAAALSAAQEQVDTAAFGQQVSDLRYQGLQLQQRLANTYDTTGAAQERRGYILNQLVPQVAAEVAAAQNQVNVAAQQSGVDSEAWRQAMLNLLGKQNDLAQLNVDANEATAENTASLKELTGSLLFETRGQAYTDDLSNSNVGV